MTVLDKIDKIAYAILATTGAIIAIILIAFAVITIGSLILDMLRARAKKRAYTFYFTCLGPTKHCRLYFARSKERAVKQFRKDMRWLHYSIIEIVQEDD